MYTSIILYEIIYEPYICMPTVVLVPVVGLQTKSLLSSRF